MWVAQILSPCVGLAVACAFLLGSAACGGRVFSLPERDGSGDGPLAKAPTGGAMGSGGTGSGGVPVMGEGGAIARIPDASLLELPTANEYGGPGPSCYRAYRAREPNEPHVECTAFGNCQRSCYVDADCPQSSSSAQPVCFNDHSSSEVFVPGYCKLPCDDATPCPLGMQCLRDDIGSACYWPRSLNLPNCCGGPAYACGVFFGGCCPPLVCNDGFCMPPDWVRPQRPEPVVAKCGAEERHSCDLGGFFGVLDVPVGACRFKIPGSDQPVTALPDASSVAPFTHVTATFVDGLGQPQYAIPHVPDAAACETRVGWYFDDETKPLWAVLCPDTCECLNQAAVHLNVEVTHCPRVDTPPP
jgi:hypothetical protein